jgi:3-hydroxyethyl bacteriochlorophyllide a dehydrogenase
MSDRSAGQPTTSAAVIFTAPHRLVMRAVPLPALGAQDLLIRTSMTAIAPAHEWPRLTGALTHLPGMSFPLVPGDAAVGTVVAAGAAVGPMWQDAPVFIGRVHAPDGLDTAQGVQRAWLVAPIDEAILLDGLEPERALFIGPAGAALHNLGRAGMGAGARLIVIGQGVLGQIVARVARRQGVASVTVADASAHRLARAVADQAVLLPAAYPVPSPRSIGEVDLLVDTTGDAAQLGAWSGCLRPGGTVLLLGWYSRLDLADLQAQPGGVRVLLAAEPDRLAYMAARALLATGAIDTTGLGTHRFGPDRAAQAYAVALADPDALQVVITWE